MLCCFAMLCVGLLCFAMLCVSARGTRALTLPPQAWARAGGGGPAGTTAAAEAGLTGRIIRRLQGALPNDLECEAEAILREEPLATKRHIAFAIGYCRSQGRVWTEQVRVLQRRLLDEVDDQGR